MNIEMIISGGQTGADRGGLDAAIACGIPHGGWCPAGRRAEDGAIPPCYRLRETYSSSYLVRTEKNVKSSQGTVILTLGELRGGSARTADYARMYQRPWLHLRLAGMHPALAAAELAAFAAAHGIVSLNVAGSRESGEPGIHQAVQQVMMFFLKGGI